MKGKILNENSDQKQSYPLLMVAMGSGTVYLFPKAGTRAMVMVPSSASVQKTGEIAEVFPSACKPFTGEVILKN